MCGTRCNLEKDRAMKGCKVMGDFVPKCSQNMVKDRELKDFHFSKRS